METKKRNRQTLKTDRLAIKTTNSTTKELAAICAFKKQTKTQIIEALIAAEFKFLGLKNTIEVATNQIALPLNEQAIEQAIEQNIEQAIEQVIEQVIEQNIEQVIEQNIEQAIEQVIEQSTNVERFNEVCEVIRAEMQLLKIDAKQTQRISFMKLNYANQDYAPILRTLKDFAENELFEKMQQHKGIFNCITILIEHVVRIK